MTRRNGWRVAACSAAALWFAGSSMVAAQSLPPPGGPAPGTGPTLLVQPAATTRICDPKLDGGGAEIGYSLVASSRPYRVVVTVLDSLGNVVATPFQGLRPGGATHHHFWDGKVAGAWADPGTYTIRVAATDSRAITSTLDRELTVVRLGIKSIAAGSTVANNEWQVVYFRKNGNYAFYATPAANEWLSRAEVGDLSELDLNDGSPRPAPAIWNKTDEPALEFPSSGGVVYENDWHNYPLCYRVGAVPEFTLTMGVNSVRANGTLGGCRYPVAGWEIQVVGSDGMGSWTSATPTPLAPGGVVKLVGPAVATNAERHDRPISWHYECRPVGATTWERVPGNFVTDHRIYTILDKPYWATGGSGTQYSGPWVEVLDYLHDWADELGITLNTSDDVVEALVKGYFGQQGNLLTAIEDVHYDCPSEGGDGGATHYGGTGTVHLSKLLNAHDLGQYVNCTDCATTTSVMLSMLGTPSLELDQLGSMQLRAIWGIGCDDYTLDLWGGSHGFSYHHIITRDHGVHISDACLCVDEDGNPDATPGTPGYNNDRDWNNYEALLAHGNVSQQYQKIPKID